MAKYNILKAVEYDKTSAKFRRKYPSLQALEAAGWWLQKKYDGCFGLARINKELSACVMESRTGEIVRSCGHLLKALHAIFSHRAPCVVLGEVWKQGADFHEISGKFRRHYLAEDLVFVANDLLPECMVTSECYSVRYSTLSADITTRYAGGVKVFRATTILCFYKAYEQALEWQAAGGFDGAILRDPRSEYTIGEAKEGQIIKVKPTLSLDLAVTELTESVGEKTGRPVYTIAVLYKGQRTEVGSGMPHSAVDLPKLGDIVEIECLGITPDNRLREPRFKGIRHDKLETD